MFIELWILLLIVFALVIVLGGTLKFMIKPALEKELSRKNKDVHAKVLELKKKIGEYDGIEKLEQARNVERFQNVAVVKTRDLILQFSRWEKPSRNIRLILSFLTAPVAAVGVTNLIRHTQDVENIDFWAITLMMFMLLFFIWGAIIENVWKQRHLCLMRKEFHNIVKLSSNPLEAKDKLVKWVSESGELADSAKKLIEGHLDKWLKQDLKME